LVRVADPLSNLTMLARQTISEVIMAGQL
jgi:hypothetical protein